MVIKTQREVGKKICLKNVKHRLYPGLYYNIKNKKIKKKEDKV